MKVKELIKELEKQNPESNVYVGRDMTTTAQASVVQALQSCMTDVQPSGFISLNDEQSGAVNEVHILGFYKTKYEGGEISYESAYAQK